MISSTSFLFLPAKYSAIERTLSYSITTDIKKRRFDKPIPIITNLKNERKGKKLCRLRILKVSDLLLHVIREWIDYVESNDRIIELKTKKSMKDFLFCGVDGQLALPEYYFQIYKRQLSKNGYDYKDFNLYRFRHNFCTRALRQGIEPKIVQALMGDETLEMVLRVYDTINDSEILKASGDFAQNMDYTLSLVEPST
ncbi:tyrosine-type recombinase/integrase [Acetanaerobacterium elongatum]|uniref:tyrosine-type recombinase/integrase n=1 Tax=Acetanaerobacterium elongatum TaxID=258515 RepID=UPI000B88C8C6|nr:tyrosine-type recombinase/integrase [Acetanaerobacterium elongatum]